MNFLITPRTDPWNKMHCYDRTTENKQFNVILSTNTVLFSSFVKDLLHIVTPLCVLCSVINRDVMYTEDAGQVHPPGGGLLIDF